MSKKDKIFLLNQIKFLLIWFWLHDSPINSLVYLLAVLLISEVKKTSVHFLNSLHTGIPIILTTATLGAFWGKGYHLESLYVFFITLIINENFERHCHYSIILLIHRLWIPARYPNCYWLSGFII